MSEWLTAIRDNLAGIGADKVPEGWKTTLQISKELNISRCHAHKIITQLRQLGRIEHKQFKIPVGAGNFCKAISHFRIKNEKAKSNKARLGDPTGNPRRATKRKG